MKKQDFKNKDIQELNQILSELKIKLFKLNFELAEKKLKDFNQLNKTRKEIARILTSLNRK